MIFTRERADTGNRLETTDLKRMKERSSIRYLAAIGMVTLLSGCAVKPDPITEDEARARVMEDQQRIYADQELVFKPIGFHEAVARALKYNLDYRLKAMESALSYGLFEVAGYDMLPSLVASAGYTSRNNDSGGNSVNIDTGDISLFNSTSQERRHSTGSIAFTWNMLDFGMSYYGARQRSNEFLIAEERRQRVIQNILQDVRASYWRAVGAQRLADRAQQLSIDARKALELSRTAEAQGLVPAKDALTYQRMLLDAVALLTARQQELDYAKRELAALLNITPGTPFTVADEALPELPPVPYNLSELEELALIKRPELREEDYRKRITADEARRQLTSMLPGLRFDVGASYDSNKYLYNNDWTDAGVQLSMNLLRPLSLPAMKRMQAAREGNDEARRLSLSMAVITQVRLSVERYKMSLQDLNVMDESNQVDQKLVALAEAEATSRTGNELELIRTQTRALNSEYQRYAAYAAAQAAYGRIYNSIGLSVLPDNISDMSVQELAETLRSHLEDVQDDTFPRWQTSAAVPSFSAEQASSL